MHFSFAASGDAFKIFATSEMLAPSMRLFQFYFLKLAAKFGCAFLNRRDEKRTTKTPLLTFVSFPFSSLVPCLFS
jgi:hypothetical protein